MCLPALMPLQLSLARPHYRSPTSRPVPRNPWASHFVPAPDERFKTQHRYGRHRLYIFGFYPRRIRSRRSHLSPLVGCIIPLFQVRFQSTLQQRVTTRPASRSSARMRKTRGARLL
ncbi:hypothetical protein PLICRDRAFT_211655 [Plicaturopsis crispa FD-325 SS-3]|nr:hypothetical protein PLICRDRAFT_211655 [Plicaturopsis crispa FD-325 SS-3]